MNETNPPVSTSAKRDALLTVYQICWEDMCWRRNAGYRTIILGLAYCGILLAIVGANRQMTMPVRSCLAAIIALAALFGAAYLVSNYSKYTSAMKRMVKIEEYVGAYQPDYLGELGALMTADRKALPDVPLAKNAICLWSIIALLAGGFITAAAVMMV